MVGGQETGNETYVKGLVAGFKALANGPDLVVYNAGRPWTEPAPNVRFQRLTTASPYVRLGLELPVRSLGLNLLHVTYAAPLWSRSPLVLTVHDICYATNPEWFSQRDLRVLNANVPRSLRQAAHVITDSQASRRQIIETYKVPEEEISAIAIGPGAGAEAIDENQARIAIAEIGLPPERPYLLAVGNLQPRKNLVRLIDAYRMVVGRGHDIDLVVVGPQHYRAEDAVAAAASVSERVHFTGYVTDRQLAACYRCATAFVFPSLYEGFGLPALEAMSHGVPLACSDAGSLPEVCGDAALLFDPTSLDAIAESIQKLLDDSQLRNRLSAAGLERARQFSWSRTAAATLDVYRSVAR
jgi:glycosyltransferase involved in cell wall biosynthesis